MKRFLGFSLAMFFALVAIALFGGDSGAVAGHGCHGKRCHGGLLARLHECHGREKKCHGRERCHGRKHRRCHGEVECCDPCCEPACGCESGCTSCGGCAGGDCGAEGVIESEAVPTEAPAAPAAAAPAST